MRAETLLEFSMPMSKDSLSERVDGFFYLKHPKLVMPKKAGKIVRSGFNKTDILLHGMTELKWESFPVYKEQYVNCQITYSSKLSLKSRKFERDTGIKKHSLP